MPNSSIKFKFLFLISALLSNCADYPNWKKRQWVIDKKGYNTQDTIYVKDFILHLSEKTPFRDTLKVYEDKLVFEDSIFDIVRNGLLKTGLNFKFIDNPKNKIDSNLIRKNRVEMRLFDKESSSKVLNEIEEVGYKLLPIIEIMYIAGGDETKLFLTICIYNAENKLIYRKSRQRRLELDFENAWINTAIPIPYWNKLIYEILEDYR